MRTIPEIINEFSCRYNAPLTREALVLLASVVEEKKVTKGEPYLAAGEVNRHIAYVEKGLMRQFYYKNGRDVTEHFTAEGYMIFCINSLFCKKPTELMAEALEDSVLYAIPYDKLLLLAEQSALIFHFLRKLLEAALILSQQKADSWRFETARERYERFTLDFPEAARRASVNHIASYLLMTPESLSRIRSEQVKK